MADKRNSDRDEPGIDRAEPATPVADEQIRGVSTDDDDFDDADELDEDEAEDEESGSTF